MNAYLTGGLCLAALAIVVYVIAEARLGRGPDMARVVHIVLSCSGLAAGVRIIVVVIDNSKLGPFTDEDRIYLILGGIALIIASLQNLLAIVASVFPSDESADSVDAQRRDPDLAQTRSR